MVFNVEGDIYRAGKTKKGGFYLNVLVKRPDGQSDSLTIFSDKEHKPGGKFKGMVDFYVKMGNEV